MSPICKRCHRFKKKSVWARHRKNCIPSRADILHHVASKSSSIKRDKRKLSRREKRLRKKGRKK